MVISPQIMVGGNGVWDMEMTQVRLQPMDAERKI